MGRLEKVDGGNWREFLAAPTAVLVIGKSDCPACTAWSEELDEFLAKDTEWSEIRFGKMLLDQGGLIDFKRANPWLADLDVLPFNQIYVAGERTKGFPGGGIDRLVSRLEATRASVAGR
jgi:hypothetical protein